MSLPKNVNSWKKSDLITAFNALDISSKGDNGKDLLVQALKQKILTHLEQNEADKSRIETFTSGGQSPLENTYSSLQNTIWLNKNPRDWCPSLEQIKNMYGRCVLTGLLFSCPIYFPPKNALVKFGYYYLNGNISLNLSPSLIKEKNIRTVLTSVLRKLDNFLEGKGKRKAKKQNNNHKAKRPKTKNGPPLIE